MMRHCDVLCRPVLHEQRLAHTDLKPENILFVNSDYDYAGTKRIHHKASIHRHSALLAYLLLAANYKYYFNYRFFSGVNDGLYSECHGA